MKDMMNNTLNRANIQVALYILLEIQEILSRQLCLPPFEELRKSILIVEQKNIKQFHLVDRWLFELQRHFYDMGSLRGVPDEKCDSLFAKIEKVQILLREIGG